MNSKVYERRISKEEADKGRLFIFKSKLADFPAVGSSIQLEVDNGTFEAKIEDKPCTCVGHDKPHHHYFASSELAVTVSKKKDEVITVYKTGDRTYRLSFT